GFGPHALHFFKALAFHQTKDWFEANREIYETQVKAPMGDLVEDVAARLAKARTPIKGDRKSSVFRIHRDVRFSKNKDPYKTHAGAAMTRSGAKSDPGLLYFHLSPEQCFFAAGFHLPNPHELAHLRASAARDPKAFKRMTAKLRTAGLSLSDQDSLIRCPRGFEDIDDPEIAAAVRLRSFIAERSVAAEQIGKPALAEDFCAFAKDAMPLLAWGWNALAETR
ncbi:MAG: TIGR02453 family protein, partial [Caulobacteraceae bacterium]|nr:TIGR02453 family protein [Caulobacteraceae bacterium]